MGGYWRGGKWIEITWGGKISSVLSTKRHWKIAHCVHCDKEFLSPGTKKWCSNKCRYEHEKSDDPYVARARSGSSNIRLGRGKAKLIEDLFRKSIDRPCTYCGTILTFENSQIDHRTPKRAQACQDSVDNLQIICRRCNIAKGEMDDAKFRKLLAFLRTDPMIYKAVWRKLGMSGHGWRAVKDRK